MRNESFLGIGPHFKLRIHKTLIEKHKKSDNTSKLKLKLISIDKFKMCGYEIN
jgi:hypothetical protein